MGFQGSERLWGSVEREVDEVDISVIGRCVAREYDGEEGGVWRSRTEDMDRKPIILRREISIFGSTYYEYFLKL